MTSEVEQGFQRTVEEFLMVPLDIRHVPLDATSLAREISQGLQAPEIRKHLEDFFLGANRFSQVKALSIMADAFYDGTDTRRVAEATLDITVFEKPYDSDGKPEYLDITESEEPLDEARLMLYERDIRIHTGYIDLGPDEDLYSRAAEFIRNLFNRNREPHPFDIQPVREEEPSWFCFVIVDRPPAT